MSILDLLKTVPAFLTQLVLLLLLISAKLARLAEERRRQLDLEPRRPTVYAAVLLVIGLVLGLAGQFPGIYGFTVDNHPIQYVQTITIMGAYFSLQFLYLPPREARPGPIRRETTIFVVVAVALAVVSGLLWAYALPDDDSPANQHSQPLVAAFYLVGVVYLTYIAGAVAIRSWGYVRPTTGWTRAGLVLVALGAAMQSLGSLSRLFTLIDAVVTGRYPHLVYQLASPLFNLSKPIVVVGLTLPFLAGRMVALSRGVACRVRYQRSETLHTVSLLVFPEIEHRNEPGTGNTPPPAPRAWFSFRYGRRVAECRDAISRARGYGAVGDDAVIEAHDDSVPQRFWAELVECGVEQTDRQFADIDGEARYQARLSVAMRDRGISWVSSGSRAARDVSPPVPDQT